MLLRIVAFAIFLSATSLTLAQEAFTNWLPSASQVAPRSTIPESAWLDLRQNVPDNSTPQSAPNWVESVAMVPQQTSSDETKPEKSVFRIRVAKPPGDYSVLFFRLFFDDNTDARPELVAWDESGTEVLRSGALGSGINVASSDAVMIPMHGVSAIDIEVPGDGKTVRGAFLDWMTSNEVVRPLSADHRAVVSQPFAQLPPLNAPSHDVEKFGAVTATLSTDTIPIGPSPEQGAAFEFGVEAQPLLALLTFEVASPRVDAPPEVYVNGENIGAVTLTLPELADPGYRGVAQSMVREMRFHYTGWLRAQKIVPVSNLKVGTNDIIVMAGTGTSTAAIRATQIQLKYLWEKSDYLLKTGPTK